MSKNKKYLITGSLRQFVEIEIEAEDEPSARLIAESKPIKEWKTWEKTDEIFFENVEEVEE